MPITQDVQTAFRIVRNLLVSRGERGQVAKRSKELAHPRPGTLDVVLYFADSKVNLYQVRQWYAPLAELAKTTSVAILSRSPGTALALLDESPVPVLYLRTVIEIEDLLDHQDPKIVLYVNQNAKNFQMFRYGRMWHVFINHGESDKMYMTTNQFKAYDYSFVAGEAARDRLRRKLWDYDIENRTIMIGRPQADHFAGALPYTPDSRIVVLYSPTWEGDREAAAYGSVATHGVALVAALLATGQHRLIYRPHPRSGVIDPDFKRANEAIFASMRAANAADPTAQHVIDTGQELGWQLVAADVAIADISAMVYDRLATGKPLLVTRPVSAKAEIDLTGFLGDAEWLDAADSADIAAVLDRVQHSAEAQQHLEFWVDRHFGDTTQGEATRRFHAAVDHLTTEWQRQSVVHAADVKSMDRNRDASDDDDD
ncbi:MAG: rane protein [Microbacteriaceae bacterium]|nr:rane protein [Microbacteriaceae bacterium]